MTVPVCKRALRLLRSQVPSGPAAEDSAAGPGTAAEFPWCPVLGTNETPLGFARFHASVSFACLLDRGRIRRVRVRVEVNLTFAPRQEVRGDFTLQANHRLSIALLGDVGSLCVVPLAGAHVRVVVLPHARLP